MSMFATCLLLEDRVLSPCVLPARQKLDGMKCLSLNQWTWSNVLLQLAVAA